MICPNCGTQLPDQARFCGVCGATLAQQQGAPQQSAPQQGMYQQSAPQQGMYQQSAPQQAMYQQGMYQQGAPQQAAWQQGMQTGMPVPPVGGQPKKGKKRKIVLTVIAVLGVLIGGLVGYSFFCTHRTYESDSGKYEAKAGYAEFSMDGKRRDGAYFSCSPNGDIVLNYMRGKSEDNVYFRLEVPKSWMKSGNKVKTSDLGDDAELTMKVGEKDVWYITDFKVTFEDINFSGLRLPGEDYAFLPFGVCKISFRIEFYDNDRGLCTLEGFGVSDY